MNNKSQNLKNFVRNWNFANPKWEKLPASFPILSTSGLSREEQHLLEAIKTAWIISGGGRTYFFKKLVKRTAITAAIIFVLIVGGNMLTNSQTDTNTVSAKTVSRTVNNIVEATRSAIFRK